MLFGGVPANQHRVSLVAVLVAGIAGAILGGSLGYALGHRYGRRILAGVPDRLLDADKAERTEALVRRLGGKAVFVGRFATAARFLVPSLAGTSRIPYGRFLFFNVTGGGAVGGQPYSALRQLCAAGLRGRQSVRHRRTQRQPRRSWPARGIGRDRLPRLAT